jgi:hypothetical protein
VRPHCQMRLERRDLRRRDIEGTKTVLKRDCRATHGVARVANGGVEGRFFHGSERSAGSRRIRQCEVRLPAAARLWRALARSRRSLPIHRDGKRRRPDTMYIMCAF